MAGRERYESVDRLARECHDGKPFLLGDLPDLPGPRPSRLDCVHVAAPRCASRQVAIRAAESTAKAILFAITRRARTDQGSLAAEE